MSALVELYHVPRTQVWEGSRGHQRGQVHLHVTETVMLSNRLHRKRGEALCGRSGWYPRPPEGETVFCPRCTEIAERFSLVREGSSAAVPVPEPERPR